MQNNIFIILYLLSFVLANLLVKHLGATGLWFSSFLLIPFDFICRCLFHESWKGKKLVFNLTLLTLCSAVLTYIINQEAVNIAQASVCGYVAAQIGAGIFYQRNKNKSFFYKVNISDLIAICFDSIAFQYIAFNVINYQITVGQITIKFLGGLFWYFILFKLFNLQSKFTKQ